MTELRDFNHVLIDEDYDNLPEGMQLAAELYAKMDSEGGLTSLLAYGGPDYFPVELRIVAGVADLAIEELRLAVQLWAAERGVRY